MGKFRFKIILMALVFTLAVPYYAFAEISENDVPEPEIIVVEPETIEPYGAGVWDPIDTQKLTLYYAFARSTKTLSTGGGDFKVKVTSLNHPSNTVYITPVVNGTPLTMTPVPLINGTREMIIRDIPKGQVYFLCRTSMDDTIDFEFFD